MPLSTTIPAARDCAQGLVKGFRPQAMATGLISRVSPCPFSISPLSCGDARFNTQHHGKNSHPTGIAKTHHSFWNTHARTNKRIKSDKAARTTAAAAAAAAVAAAAAAAAAAAGVATGVVILGIWARWSCKGAFLPAHTVPSTAILFFPLLSSGPGRIPSTTPCSHKIVCRNGFARLWANALHQLRSFTMSLVGSCVKQ